MKKLFLTSGIIACMACPAFATDPVIAFPASGHNDGYVAPSYLNPADSDDGITDGTGECVSSVLETSSGPVQLQAQWEHNYRPITLSPNIAANGWNGTSSVSQSTIYAVPGDTNLYTMGAYDNLSVYSSYNTNGDTTPLGKTETITYDYNLPTVGVGNADAATAYTQYSAANDVSGYATDVTTANRLFNGFWRDQTGGTASDDQFISDAGVITTAGTTYASSVTASDTAVTWYAQYKCASPASVATPSLRGYDFKGWTATSSASDLSELSIQSGDYCVTDSNKTVYAKWAPHTGTITYSCGSAGGSATQTGTVPSAQNVAYDQEISLAANTCVFSGYTFTGWSCTHNLTSTSDNSATTTYSASETLLYRVPGTNATTPVATTCTAQWTQNKIALHWDANNATTVTSQGGYECTYDGAVTVPQVSRTGYTLTGWTVTATEDDVTNPVDTATAARPQP